MKASGVYEPGPRNERCFRPFVPDPPPLERVADALDEASTAIRRFESRLLAWGDPAVVGRLFARLDAVSSAGAEGSTTTFTDLLEYESSLGTAPDAPDAASVSALSDAAFADTDDDPVRLARRFHKRLFERGTKLQAAEAGKLKNRVNRVRDEDAPTGMFAYTRPESIDAAMAEWAEFSMAISPALPELVRQCLAHWMFEHVHPFHDGNGRVGRLMTPTMLLRKGFTTTVCAFIGEPVYFEKDLYIDGLKAARASGDMTSWTRLMLSFLRQNADANTDRLDAMTRIRDRWRRAVSGHRADAAIHRIVEFAITQPAFTIADAVAGVGGTFPAVNNAAGRLVELGVLEIAKGARRDRLFQAPEILDVFDHFRTRSRGRDVDDASPTMS